MEPPITEANPTENNNLPDLSENNTLPGPSSPPAISPSSPLAAMLELLREQEEERRNSAASLAQSLLRSCGSTEGTGSSRAREIAQATAHEALRSAKANSGNKSNTGAHHQGSASLLEDSVVGKGAFFSLAKFCSAWKQYTMQQGIVFVISP